MFSSSLRRHHGRSVIYFIICCVDFITVCERASERVRRKKTWAKPCLSCLLKPPKYQHGTALLQKPMFIVFTSWIFSQRDCTTCVCTLKEKIVPIYINTQFYWFLILFTENLYDWLNTTDSTAINVNRKISGGFIFFDCCICVIRISFRCKVIVHFEICTFWVEIYWNKCDNKKTRADIWNESDCTTIGW